MKARLDKAGVENQGLALRPAAGQAFYNAARSAFAMRFAPIFALE